MGNPGDSSHDISIRLAKHEDAATIASVLSRSFVEYEPLYTREAFETTTPSPKGIRARLDEGPMWVTVERGKIVGTGSAVLDEYGLYVRGMAVDPQSCGRGIGFRLLAEIQTYAIQRQCRRIFLSTTPFLDRAIRLYERFGFFRTSEGPYELFGTPLFTMEKPLPNNSQAGRDFQSH